MVFTGEGAAIQARSLANAEVAEDTPEQVVAAYLAGDFAEHLLSLAQLLGKQFPGVLLFKLLPAGLDMLMGPAQRIDVAPARGETAVAVVVITDTLLQVFAQAVKAIARENGEGDAGIAIALFRAGRTSGQVDLVVDTGMRNTVREFRQYRCIRGRETRLVIQHQQHAVGLFQRRACTLHAGLFHRVVTVMQTGRIDDVQWQAIQLDMFSQHVARGAGYLGDDGDIPSGQGIQQAGLAGVGTTCNDQRHAIAQQFTLVRAGAQIGEGRVDLRQQVRDGVI